MLKKPEQWKNGRRGPQSSRLLFRHPDGPEDGLSVMMMPGLVLDEMRNDLDNDHHNEEVNEQVCHDVTSNKTLYRG